MAVLRLLLSFKRLQKIGQKIAKSRLFRIGGLWNAAQARRDIEYDSGRYRSMIALRLAMIFGVTTDSVYRRATDALIRQLIQA